MKATQVIAALRAAWWLPLVGLVVGGAAAFGVTALQTPVYASTTQFLVSAAGEPQGQTSLLAEQRAASYARLAVGADLAERVVKALELDMSPADLRKEISANAIEGTVLVDVSVTDRSRERAQSIANTVRTAFPKLVATVEAQGPDGQPRFLVRATERPDLATSPVSRGFVRNVAVGLLVGFLVGALGAVARRLVATSVKDAQQAAELAGAVVVAQVPRDDTLAERRMLPAGGSGAAAEQFHRLVTNLQWLDVDEPPKVMIITGAVSGQGATTTVINLALALAESGHTVAVVEADLRRPHVTESLGLTSEPGVTNVLARSVPLADVVQRYGAHDLWVVPAGPTPPDPARLLASSHMHTLIEKLRGEYDHVLVDGPPVLPDAGTSGLAGAVDGALLVVRHGGLPPEQLRRAAGALEQAGIRTLGLVLTAVPTKLRPVDAQRADAER